MLMEPRSTAALKTFLRVADRWSLDSAQRARLLGIAPATIRRWQKLQPERLSPDVWERIAHLVGIFKALETLLPVSSAADAWIKKSNAAPIFGGKSALDRMLAGQVGDLFVVRQYLDAQVHAG